MSVQSCGRGAGCAIILSLLFFITAVSAEEGRDHISLNGKTHDHKDHAMPDKAGGQKLRPPAAKSPKKDKKPAAPSQGHDKHSSQGHSKIVTRTSVRDHTASNHGVSGEMADTTHGAMVGFLGPYSMTREASGTSWQPDTSPHEGFHQQLADWSVMIHGWLNLVYDQQGGPRGNSQTFASGMLMTMAQRPLGDGTFGLRAMLSPEPFMGPSGYPLLLATGETANGISPLIDRQHPHDLFMELAATYNQNITANSSVFIYGGLPGEPALGPPAFMHRTSGMDNPEAPISHHWLDSTHITFGVLTAGVVVDKWKFEGSVFRGREPDQHRYDIERPYLDSFAGRVSWNPIRELSLQVSYGRINSAEQLEPEVNENRLTASAIYTKPFGDGHLWSTTFAWGRKMLQPGDTLDAYLLESSVIFRTNYTVFMRAERVAENELTHDIVGLEGRTFTVNKMSLGGIYDFYRTERVKFGVGGLVSKYGIPSELLTEYGRDPTSFMVFGRLKIL